MIGLKSKVLILLVLMTWLATIYCAYCYWSELSLGEKIFLEIIASTITIPLADLLHLFKK